MTETLLIPARQQARPRWAAIRPRDIAVGAAHTAGRELIEIGGGDVAATLKTEIGEAQVVSQQQQHIRFRGCGGRCRRRPGAEHGHGHGGNALAALHHLGDAVDRDQLVGEFAVGAVIAATVVTTTAITIAATAAFTIAATTTATLRRLFGRCGRNVCHRHGLILRTRDRPHGRRRPGLSPGHEIRSGRDRTRPTFCQRRARARR